MVTIDTSYDIPIAIENGKEIAKVDATYTNDIKVILTDREDKYIQRFFIGAPLVDLVERTIMMRSIGVESL